MSTPLGAHVKHVWTDKSAYRPANQRLGERQAVTLPARLTWKDHRGATRFASVVTRNVSQFGVYVECQSTLPIPLYRLVQFQLERDVRESDVLPESLRQSHLLSAVYRVSPPTPHGGPQGLALRLMVDPKRAAAIEQRPELPAQTHFDELCARVSQKKDALACLFSGRCPRFRGAAAETPGKERVVEPQRATAC